MHPDDAKVWGFQIANALAARKIPAIVTVFLIVEEENEFLPASPMKIRARIHIQRETDELPIEIRNTREAEIASLCI
jgi:hypothetical protein